MRPPRLASTSAGIQTVETGRLVVLSGLFIGVRICRGGALYKSHGSGRLLMQSTNVVFWPSLYRPAL